MGLIQSGFASSLMERRTPLNITSQGATFSRLPQFCHNDCGDRVISVPSRCRTRRSSSITTRTWRVRSRASPGYPVRTLFWVQVLTSSRRDDLVRTTPRQTSRVSGPYSVCPPLGCPMCHQSCL
jgi:hypothetical protein